MNGSFKSFHEKIKNNNAIRSTDYCHITGTQNFSQYYIIKTQPDRPSAKNHRVHQIISLSHKPTSTKRKGNQQQSTTRTKSKPNMCIDVRAVRDQFDDRLSLALPRLLSTYYCCTLLFGLRVLSSRFFRHFAFCRLCKTDIHSHCRHEGLPCATFASRSLFVCDRIRLVSFSIRVKWTKCVGLLYFQF